MHNWPEAGAITDIERLIREEELVFVYIFRPDCGVCHAVLPRVQKLLEEFPSVRPILVNADRIPEVAGVFSVFTVPALLLFVEGKEVLREARFIVMEELQHKLDRIVSAFQ